MKIGILAGSLMALAVSAPAWADARADVMQAFEKAMAEDGYRVRMAGEAGGKAHQSTLDMQPPDRFHLRSPESEVIVLPGATWMNAAGQWMKLPMDMSGMIRSMTLSAVRDAADTMQDVQKTGSESVNGCESGVYTYRAKGEALGFKADADVTVWICESNGLPVRVISLDAARKARTVLDYDYDTEIRIQAPN